MARPQISLKNGTGTIYPKPDLPIRVAELEQVIYDAGMELAGVHATITGVLTTWQGALALKVPESGQVFVLLTEGKLKDRLAAQQGPVTVNGELQSGDGGPDLLQVTRVVVPE